MLTIGPTDGARNRLAARDHDGMGTLAVPRDAQHAIGVDQAGPATFLTVHRHAIDAADIAQIRHHTSLAQGPVGSNVIDFDGRDHRFRKIKTRTIGRDYDAVGEGQSFGD